jgi:hypothetical protein
MNTLSTDTQDGITSELIDLDTVPLSALTALDNDELHRSMDHVVKQTRQPRMSHGNSSSMGIAG